MAREKFFMFVSGDMERPDAAPSQPLSSYSTVSLYNAIPDYRDICLDRCTGIIIVLQFLYFSTSLRSTIQDFQEARGWSPQKADVSRTAVRSMRKDEKQKKKKKTGNAISDVIGEHRQEKLRWESCATEDVIYRWRRVPLR